MRVRSDHRPAPLASPAAEFYSPSPRGEGRGG